MTIKGKIGVFILVLICSISPSFSQVDNEIFTGYNYTHHGEDWTDGECANASIYPQSPINLGGAQPYVGTRYFFANYSAANSQVNFYNVTVNVSTSDTNGFGILYALTADGSRNIAQGQYIVFRAPAEHPIGNVTYPLEMQIYHKLTSAAVWSFYQNLVVSVFFNESIYNSSNPLLDQILNTPNQTYTSIDLSQLLNFQSDSLNLFAYEGSMSYPPCSAYYQWLIFENPFSASSAQIQKFTNMFAPYGNNRALQNNPVTTSLLSYMSGTP